MRSSHNEVGSQIRWRGNKRCASERFVSRSESQEKKNVPMAYK